MIKFNNTTITYNLNGQISSKVVPGVGTTTYSYDSFGNLLEVQTPTNHVKYEVDGRNRRTEVKQFSSVFKTRYVWDGQLRVIAELASNNALVKKYVYAEGVNSPEYMIFEGKKYLFVKDHRGSVNLVVNAETGEVKQKIRYSEWGEVLEDTNPGFQPLSFAGGLYDSVTKLYRFGARDYDPELGRWLSKDPIRFEGGDTNLYGYVLQDPVNLLDQTGLNALDVGVTFIDTSSNEEIIGGAVGGTIGGAVGAVGGPYCALAGAYIGGEIGASIASSMFPRGDGSNADQPRQDEYDNIERPPGIGSNIPSINPNAPAQGGPMIRQGK